MSNSASRFTLMILYVDGNADVARTNDEGKVRRVIDQIIEQPEGVASVTFLDGSRSLPSGTAAVLS